MNNKREYIDKQELVAELKTVVAANGLTGLLAGAYNDIIQHIEKKPAADVEEVQKEKWEHLGGDEWICTGCGFVITTEGSWEKPQKARCENCGAIMEKEAEEWEC